MVHGEGLREDADDARVARRRRVVLDDDLRVVVDVVLALLHVADGHAPPVWKSNLQPDFNVRICGRFDARLPAVLRELGESNRSVQKSAESTSI